MLNPDTFTSPPETNRFRRALAHRHGGLLIFLAIFLATGFATRVALLWKSRDGVAFDASLAGAFALGTAFDVAMGLLFCVLPAFALTATPERLFRTRAFRLSAHITFCVAIAVFLFVAVSEWLFWDEFGVRFNFIAVDYLVYTTEVIRNIRESYNMTVIFGALAATTALVWAGVNATGVFSAWIRSEAAAKGRGRIVGLIVVLLPVVVVFVGFRRLGGRDMRADHSSGGFVEKMSAGLRHMGDFQPSFHNAFNGELAKNGQYAFVAAFWSNELDYDAFYPKLAGKDGEESFRRLRTMLTQDNTTFVTGDPRDITRVVRPSGPEKKLNVIQITVESLSAEFLGCYGEDAYGPRGLTPNLDRISEESLWFRHAYATGTRTVRGMEALSLSIPPTPGQAILRRPHCENLPTLGGVLRNHGYDCSFVYGGDGLFDNMNFFFENNGYRVVDHPARMNAHPETKVRFANAWGASDEDLFGWVIDEADTAYAAGKPFHQFVMTTSNHRPFTWPSGRINPMLKGRDGGVAYTDHAIGELIKHARAKPWFKDTVFVIVADHCASVAGKRELEVRKYEIPMFVYCPAHITPKRVETMVSQIDLAPTLLGLLDLTYVSRFFGHDALRPSGSPEHVFVSNYQKIATLSPDSLVVLKPVAQSTVFACDTRTGELHAKPSTEMTADAVAWYGCAATLFKQGRLAALSPEEENALLKKTK
jgi:hypothetical protein